jgi:nicotinamide/nicotinate riboside kinase
MTPQHPQTSKNLIVGLSGPSSSGKTTLARLLRSIFNIAASAQTNHNSITLFILHEDDFYKTDAE